MACLMRPNAPSRENALRRPSRAGGVAGGSSVALARQPCSLTRLARRFVPLDLRHRLAELLRAHRAGLPAQPTDGLLDEAERAVQGKRAAAPFPGGREGGRLVRRDRLCARLTLVTPPPTPPPPATAFAAP